MSLGRNIAKLRQIKNMTQRELAKISGISESYLSRIEIGKITHPHIKTVTRIANGLGTNIEGLRKGW